MLTYLHPLGHFLRRNSSLLTVTRQRNILGKKTSPKVTFFLASWRVIAYTDSYITELLVFFGFQFFPFRYLFILWNFHELVSSDIEMWFFTCFCSWLNFLYFSCCVRKLFSEKWLFVVQFVKIKHIFLGSHTKI